MDWEKFQQFKECVMRNDIFGDRFNLVVEESHAVCYVNPSNENDSQDVFEFKDKADFLIYINELYKGKGYSQEIGSDFADQVLSKLNKTNTDSFKVKIVPRTRMN